jgi:hypothetical protein
MIHIKPLFLIAALSLFAWSTSTSGQQNSVAITPATIDAPVKRGTSYTQIFTLTNGTNTRLRFKCSAADMGYDDNHNRVNARAGSLERSASLWIEFLPAEVVVEAHSSQAVKILVTVPLTAAGGYYSVPVFEAIPADEVISSASVTPKANTAKATFGIRFNGLMMFTTLDAAEYNIEILGGKITPPSPSMELAMQLDIRNRGNAHARVRGNFAILNSAGTLSGRGTIKETRYMPDQQKMLETTWTGELAPGKYTAVITLSYDRVGTNPAILSYELPFVVQ